MLGLCSCRAFDGYSDFMRYRQIEESAVRKQMRGYSLKVQNGYTQSIDGIEYQFKFSRASYKLGKIVKLRLTVTNNSDRATWIDRKNTSARFISADGDELVFEIVDKNEWIDQHTAAINVYCFEPGDSIVYERAVALDPDFFDTAGEYCLAFDFVTYVDAIFSNGNTKHEIKVPVQLVS